LLGEALHPEAEIMVDRPEIVDELETLAAPVPVNRADILQEIEFEPGPGFQEPDELQKALARDRDGQFAAMFGVGEGILAEVLDQLRKNLFPDSFKTFCKCHSATNVVKSRVR